MPTMPKNQKLNANGADLVNSVASTIDSGVGIPPVVAPGQRLADGSRATKAYALQTLRAAGDTIVNYQPNANAFLSALVNRIGRVLITSKLYNNPWAGFKKGLLEYGETVEELFVNIINAHQFDPEVAENEVFRREKPNVLSAFHTMNYQKFYKTTVSNDQLRQAFLSFEGITNLVGKIVEAMYTSANYDEFLCMKYMIGVKATNGGMYPINIPTPATPSNSNSIVTIMKTWSDNLTFLKSDYNEAGVFTHSAKEDQYFIMTTAFANVIDVETLALAFNLDKVELMGRIVRVDSFGFTPQELDRLNTLLADGNPSYVPIDDTVNDSLNAIPAVVVDRDFFMIFDNLTNMTEQYNAQGLYWNYFYHLWKIYSTSPFANAIIFTDETPAVTSVTITPATATASKGSLITFSADVAVAGYASRQVKWEISGQTAPATVIDQQGRLTIGGLETAATITVTATSWFDDTKSDTATVTVT